MGGGRRRRSSKPSGSLFVEGGLLNEYPGKNSKNNRKNSSFSRENSVKKGFNYNYPETSNPPVYDYHPGSFSEPHLGLGFSKEEITPENSPNLGKMGKKNPGFLSIGGMKLYTEDISSPNFSNSNPGSFSEPHLRLGFSKEEITPENSPNLGEMRKKNPGFLSIGGMKLYTEDISSPDGNESDSEDFDDSSEEDSCSDGSDVDEELVKDYLEGVGGTDELLKAEWLTEALGNNDILGDSSSSDSEDEKRGKLGPIALMNASREYGMLKVEPKKDKKNNGGGNSSDYYSIKGRDSSNWEELMFSKDRRAFSRKVVGVSSGISRSWPSHSQKIKADKKIRGEKKKQRKESIARKRRERALNRGVDLQQINTELQRLVLSETDIFSFQPMDSRDCAQVQRLASIYRLKSGCQGSGKKRFVTVLRTCHTSLPSSNDAPRLEKLLGLGEESDFSVAPAKGGSQGKSSAQDKQRRNFFDREGSSGKSRRQRPGPVYADNPVSFVSNGVMQTRPEESIIDPGPSERPDTDSSPSTLGAFELHTKGFGSRMMAKMGFEEGTGLGRDRQGIVRPIEPVRRPKSLGLGVQFEASDVEYEATTEKKPMQRPSKGLGSFERHTTGFGSKMMAKMGYVPGSGLGKDAQGITAPLSAVKLPRSVGLGSNYTR